MARSVKKEDEMGYWRENPENLNECGECVYLPGSSENFCQKYGDRLETRITEYRCRGEVHGSISCDGKIWGWTEREIFYYRCSACIIEENHFIGKLIKPFN